jgi:PAS domain S-box-containing protein
MNRITVSKYLDILQIQGQVDVRRIGTSKVFLLTQRYPVSAVTRICPFSYLVVDMNNVIVDIQRDFLQLLSRDESDVIGKRSEFLLLDMFRNQSLNTRIKEAIRGTESVLALDAVLNKKDYSFRTTFLPIVFGNGKPGAALIFENQTEFKETNRLIQQLESRYQALIEDQIEYVIRFLPNGTITYVNDAYCRDVGRDRESLQGFPFHPFIPDDDKEKVQRHFASLTRDNPVAIIEHRAIMANGQVRWQRWKDRALFDKRGKVIEYH